MIQKKKKPQNTVNFDQKWSISTNGWAYIEPQSNTKIKPMVKPSSKSF